MRTCIKALAAAALMTLVGFPASAYEPGTVLIRGGVTTVDPQTNNFYTTENLGDDQLSLAIDVRNASNLTMTGTYVFKDRWAVDILASLPFEHDIRATMQLTSQQPAPEPDLGPISDSVWVSRIARTEQLPPTVSLQYHFSPDTVFQPYAGLGLNWTTFSKTRFTSDIEEVVGDTVSKLSLDESVGIALQLGGDWLIGDHAVLNFDIRWIDIDTTASVTGPNFEGKRKLFDLAVDPWLWSLSIGYHF